jgi:hypothetical protein
MKVRGLAFCGVRTDNFDEMGELFGGLMGMTSTKHGTDMLIWRLPDGGLVEVFAEDEPEHQHFTTGPVVGFLVDDALAAWSELINAGLEMLGPLTHVGDRAYGFFRAPDGNIYEITGPAETPVDSTDH